VNILNKCLISIRRIMLYSRSQYSMISENTHKNGMGLRIDEFKLRRHLKDDEVDDIRKLIHQIVKQISANYDVLKVAKKLRDMYNKIKANRPTRREEGPDVTEDVRYLYENYPYYEAQRVFPNSFGMYVIDMEEDSTVLMEDEYHC
jgi:hypothetical protein